MRFHRLRDDTKKSIYCNVCFRFIENHGSWPGGWGASGGPWPSQFSFWSRQNLCLVSIFKHSAWYNWYLSAWYNWYLNVRESSCFSCLWFLKSRVQKKMGGSWPGGGSGGPCPSQFSFWSRHNLCLVSIFKHSAWYNWYLNVCESSCWSLSCAFYIFNFQLLAILAITAS